MIKVRVSKQSNYPVSAPGIKKKLSKFFSKNGITSSAEVSVAIVGEDRMRKVSNAYFHDNSVHNVLSFTPDEVKGEFVYPPDTLELGEIIICFPVARAEANKEDKLIDEKINELAEHAARHLLGLHHE